MNELAIHDYLKKKGMNEYGIAGLMGNLLAESALNPQNLQNTYEKSLGLTDAAYTAGVDNGTYTNFVRDKAGYGLAQWTYWSRKQALLDFARVVGKSIGDLYMQLDFLWKELSEDYPKVLVVLQSATSVLEASNAVLLNYERPTNQSESIQKKRAEYGQKYYDQFATKNEKGDRKMGNSSLSCMRVISPNKNSPRNHIIDTITPHCVVGQAAIESLCNEFSRTSKEASCNYGIGCDGRIGTIVDEADRSWCSSSSSNDNRAITIECASDAIYPYAINANVWKALVELCADICRRYGKKKVLWLGTKEATLAYTPKADEMVFTAHRWFENKSCPGDYIYNRLGQLAKEVNQKLGAPVVPFKAYQGQVNADDGLNCRTAPVTGQVLKTYLDGTVLTITKEDGSWGYTGEGWVCLDYINKIASAKDPATKEEDIMDGKQFNKLFNEMRQQWRDNDASAYSEKARTWAVEKGLIAGSSSKEFNGMWEDLMTREQLVVVLYRFAQLMNKT